MLFFCRGHSAGRRDAVEAPAEENHALGLRYAFMACALTIAIYPLGRSGPGQPGAYGSRCSQGDSLFVVSPGGKTLLIDGGGAFGGFPGREEHNGVDPGEEAVSPYLWSRGFQKLDVVALTHAHQDHAGGLLAILENFQVGKSSWIGRGSFLTSLFCDWRLTSTRAKSPRTCGRGKTIHWTRGRRTFCGRGRTSEIMIRWWALASLQPEPVLLPGDAEKQVEREIPFGNSAKAMHSDVLKIGHHGSKNSR